MAIKTSVSFKDEAYDKVKKLSINRGPDFSFMLNELIESFDGMIERTKATIRLKFTFNEINMLLDMMNGNVFIPQLGAKRALLYSIEDDIMAIDSHYLKWNVDPERIVYNINSLTEAEAYAVLLMITDFWAHPEPRDPKNLIERFFGVSSSVKTPTPFHLGMSTEDDEDYDSLGISEEAFATDPDPEDL